MFVQYKEATTDESQETETTKQNFQGKEAAPKSMAEGIFFKYEFELDNQKTA